MCAWVSSAQVTIIDTGSTNVPGLNVTIEKAGPEALVERRGGVKQKVTLTQEMCGHLLQDLKAAGPLNELPARHCMKSVSFGKSLFIEYNGVRSPDLSCPQSDPRSVALRTDAAEILNAAAKTGVPRHY